MGLCTGCKSTASLFCYEHKRNVCEGCLVKSLGEHRGCYVRPYLQWLSDESFVSGCRACGKAVDQEVLRLPCYDVYHTSCFFKLLSQLNDKKVTWEELRCPECKVQIWVTLDWNLFKSRSFERTRNGGLCENGEPVAEGYPKDSHKGGRQCSSGQTECAAKCHSGTVQCEPNRKQ